MGTLPIFGLYFENNYYVYEHTDGFVLSANNDSWRFSDPRGEQDDMTMKPGQDMSDKFPNTEMMWSNSTHNILELPIHCLVGKVSHF